MHVKLVFVYQTSLQKYISMI